MASTANSTDFGDLTQARNRIGSGGSCSATRGVFMGGDTPTKVNTIDYITIASTGDATDFGDLSSVRYAAACGSNNIRAVAAAGGVPGASATIDYITIASTGDGADFGDCTTARNYPSGLSNGHGGLS